MEDDWYVPDGGVIASLVVAAIGFLVAAVWLSV
jgi:hypothetical protein